MRKFFLIFLLFGGHLVQAQSFTKMSNTSECKAKIDKKAKSTNAISANFSETVYSAMFNNPKTGSGKLNYKKSNKIRWEHTAPKKQIVLINGSKVRLFENGKENKNAASSQVIKKVQALMIQLFSGDFLNEKEFNIEYYQSSLEYKLILKPKSSRMSKYISKVEMYFSKKELTLNKMVLVESADERIVYGFSNIVVNGQISESSFTQF